LDLSLEKDTNATPEDQTMKTVKYFVILKLIFLSDLVLSFATWNKGRERPQKQESVEVEKTDNGVSLSKMTYFAFFRFSIFDFRIWAGRGPKK
jgi:hypothetical protein